MKWKPTRAMLPPGSGATLRPLVSPALTSSLGATVGEVDDAEVEVDDEDPLAGVEDGEAAAGGDDPGERQLLVLGHAPGQAVVEGGARGPAASGSAGRQKTTMLSVNSSALGQLDQHHRAPAPGLAGSTQALGRWS